MFEKIWKWLKKFNSKKNRLIHGKYHKCSLKICMLDPIVPLVMASCWKLHELETHRISSYYVNKNKMNSTDPEPTNLKTRMSKWHEN